MRDAFGSLKKTKRQAVLVKIRKKTVIFFHQYHTGQLPQTEVIQRLINANWGKIPGKHMKWLLMLAIVKAYRTGANQD